MSPTDGPLSTTMRFEETVVDECRADYYEVMNDSLPTAVTRGTLTIDDRRYSATPSLKNQLVVSQN